MAQHTFMNLTQTLTMFARAPGAAFSLIITHSNLRSLCRQDQSVGYHQTGRTPRWSLLCLPHASHQVWFTGPVVSAEWSALGKTRSKCNICSCHDAAMVRVVCHHRRARQLHRCRTRVLHPADPTATAATRHLLDWHTNASLARVVPCRAKARIGHSITGLPNRGGCTIRPPAAASAPPGEQPPPASQHAVPETPPGRSHGRPARCSRRLRTSQGVVGVEGVEVW